ncbi:hypothetical protein AAVH_33667 [Aphelenchoides avenae]|nr:hypothetical protein AAVH_33667 [Aphelenchus avenae]
MWALKTNATDLIVATLTYGIMCSNASVQVKVALREGQVVDIFRHNDKLAFDYLLVSPKQCTFEPQRLLQDNRSKRRKRFHIQYVA